MVIFFVGGGRERERAREEEREREREECQFSSGMEQGSAGMVETESQDVCS